MRIWVIDRKLSIMNGLSIRRSGFADARSYVRPRTRWFSSCFAARTITKVSKFALELILASCDTYALQVI
jgi:hypothetical protein